MNIQTIQSNIFKGILHHIKNVFIECEFHFCINGIYVSAMSNIEVKKSTFVHLFIPSYYFEIYEIDKNYKNTFSLNNLYKICNTQDILVFKNTDNHFIISTIGKYTMNYTFPTCIESNLVQRSIPLYSTKIEIDTIALYKIIKKFTDNITIHITKDSITFVSKEKSICINQSISIQESYSVTLDYIKLSKITSSKPICKKTYIYVKENYPFIIEYNMETFGKLYLAI